MNSPAGSSDIGVPTVLAPYKRMGTDVVSRKLDIFPYPNSSVNSTNASQVLRFDFPPSVMLDCTNQGLELNFTLAITANSSLSASTFSRIQAFPGECLGHLINTIRVYINNEMVEETLNFGQLSSMLQQATENIVDSSCFEQNVKGRYTAMETYPYEIRNDGMVLLGSSQYQIGWCATQNSGTTVSFNSSVGTGSGSSVFPPYNGLTSGAADNSGLWLTLQAPYAEDDSKVYDYRDTYATTELLTIPNTYQCTVGTAVLIGKECLYTINGNGYNIPQSFRNSSMSLYQQKTALRNGVKFTIPLAVGGQFFNQRLGLIPLHRLPKVRMEITFNPAAYVLFAPTSQSSVNTLANFNAQDYLLSNMRISAMYCQSPTLVSLYDAGNWEYSYLGFSYFTAPMSQLMPISMPFKSSRYIIGVFAGAGQYTGISSGTWTPNTTLGGGTGLPLLDGQIVTGSWPRVGSSEIIGPADSTRWSNWYGLGGCYGGSAYIDNTSEPLPHYLGTGITGLVCTPVGSYQGRDPDSQISALNFQQNNEWIFQQDLTGRDQFWRELTKVLPSVKRSSFFNVTNYPGVRFILAINLQTPELSDQYICGNRAAQGQSLGYLKVTTGPTNNSTATGTPVTGCLFQSWIVYDRVVKVQERSGLTVVDY